MTLPQQIRIAEVGPRDGLQNESAIVPVDTKVAFIDALSQSGVAEIEVTSFVHPKWVPQLADAADVLSRIARRDGVMYSALVPNMKGLERAVDIGVDQIAVFTAASETFSERNTNATIAETIERSVPVVDAAHGQSWPVRGYISCVVACPYEGRIDPAAVRDVAQRLLDIGVDEIDLGETIGVAVPSDIDRLYDAVGEVIEPSSTTLHLHDTRATALTCLYRALQLGVCSFDASCVGLGGCPYAPGAAGNVPTENVVYLCEQLGIQTDVSLDALFEAGRIVLAALERSAPTGVFSADAGAADESCAADK
ncbi:MAG: hydroxymethylglutaryl-CoA lyase [Planctomycetota bacterium]